MMVRVWVPLSVRRRMFDAMVGAVVPDGVEARWAELEAALDVLQPFLVGLVEHPECALTDRGVGGLGGVAGAESFTFPASSSEQCVDRGRVLMGEAVAALERAGRLLGDASGWFEEGFQGVGFGQCSGRSVRTVDTELSGVRRGGCESMDQFEGHRDSRCVPCESGGKCERCSERSGGSCSSSLAGDGFSPALDPAEEDSIGGGAA